MKQTLASFGSVAALVFLVFPLFGQEGQASKPIGTWTRQVDGNKITLDIKSHVIRCMLTNEAGVNLTARGDYVLTKDGILVFVLRTNSATNREEPQETLKKRTFTCRISFAGRNRDRLVIRDFAGMIDDYEKVQDIFEGRYEKQPGGETDSSLQSAKTTSRMNKRKDKTPEQRLDELMIFSNEQSGPLQQIEGNQSKDKPSHMTPERVHGGIR